MFQYFLNPWLLAGLVGIGLPLAAHLISRRRFDVVDWGAMQFLNPSRKTRRRMQLEELLLLLLRMGVIGLLALAASRPWIPGGWLHGYRSAGSRTVVLVIDGSNSMSRSDGVSSVHQQAVRRATEFLQTLQGGDTVAVVDARDQPLAIVESPLQDTAAVADQLKALPPPGGACAMLPALERAMAILGRSSALSREIVVFTDRQAGPWKTGDTAAWLRFDDLLKLPAVRPRIWVLDASTGLPEFGRNIAVGRLELSRELTVPGFPLRMRTVIRNESDRESVVPVRLLLDGQPLAGRTQSLRLAPHGETAVEFEYAMRESGTHVLSVEAETGEEAIRADDVSHAAVRSMPSLPVLVLNGRAAVSEEQRASFFVQTAFGAMEAGEPWVAATVRDADAATPSDLQKCAAVVCCGVSRVTPEFAAALEQFVRSGGGLLVSCDDQMTPAAFDACYKTAGMLTGLQLSRIRQIPPAAPDRVLAAPLSIQPGWLERFRSDPGRTFLKSDFQSWAVLNIVRNTIPQTGTSAPAEDSRIAMAPAVLAQLTTGDPLLVEAQHGDGRILVLSSSLDRSGNDLASRADFVPFLHEAVFRIAAASSRRNVSAGESLIVSAVNPAPPSDLPEPANQTPSDIVPLADGTGQRQFEVTLPDGRVLQVPAAPVGAELRGVIRETSRPGILRAHLVAAEQPQPAGDQPASTPPDAFVVNYDHSEDQFVPLVGDDRARLATNDRARFAESLAELQERMYGNETTTELWAILMFGFLGLLICELLLTRRVILRGYGAEALAAESSPAPGTAETLRA